jgi:hypothetical protein
MALMALSSPYSTESTTFIRTEHTELGKSRCTAFGQRFRNTVHLMPAVSRNYFNFRTHTSVLISLSLTFTPPRPPAAVIGLRPQRRAPQTHCGLALFTLYSSRLPSAPLTPISVVLHLDLNRICLIH